MTVIVLGGILSDQLVRGVVWGGKLTLIFAVASGINQTPRASGVRARSMIILGIIQFSFCVGSILGISFCSGLTLGDGLVDLVGVLDGPVQLHFDVVGAVLKLGRNLSGSPRDGKGGLLCLVLHLSLIHI